MTRQTHACIGCADAPGDTRTEATDPASDDALVEKMADAMIRRAGWDPASVTGTYRKDARAALDAARAHEAGIAAAVEALAEDGERDGRGNSLDLARRLRRLLAGTGAADTLAARDARVLRDAAEDADRSVVTGLETTRPDQVARWLRARAARIEAGAGER